MLSLSCSSRPSQRERESQHGLIRLTLREEIIALVVLQRRGRRSLQRWDWTFAIFPISSCSLLSASLPLFILSDLIVNDMLIVNEAGLGWRPLCVLMRPCGGSGQGAGARLMFTSLRVLQLPYICPLLEKTQGCWVTDRVYCCCAEMQVPERATLTYIYILYSPLWDACGGPAISVKRGWTWMKPLFGLLKN